MCVSCSDPLKYLYTSMKKEFPQKQLESLSNITYSPLVHICALVVLQEGHTVKLGGDKCFKPGQMSQNLSFIFVFLFALVKYILYN